MPDPRHPGGDLMISPPPGFEPRRAQGAVRDPRRDATRPAAGGETCCGRAVGSDSARAHIRRHRAHRGSGQAHRTRRTSRYAGAAAVINTDSDPHWFALVGTPSRVAAVDGRDLNQPGEVSGVRLRLPAGGRYDLVFVMPDGPVALVLDNDRDGGLWLRPHDDPAGGEPAVEDTSNWPELDLLHYGIPAAVPFDAGAPDRHFTIVLDRGVAIVDGAPAYAHTVNG